MYFQVFILIVVSILVGCERSNFSGDTGTKEEQKTSPVPTPAPPPPVDADGLLQDECAGQSGSGFSGKVYQVPYNSSRLPDFSTLTPVGQLTSPQLNVPTRDFTSGFPGVPNLVEWFGIVFEGALNVQVEGDYTFTTTSDDGSKVYLDKALVVDNDGVHPPTTKTSASMRLKAGVYPLKVEWFQGPAKQIALQLYWKTPGSNQNTIIPIEALKFRKDCDLNDLGTF